MRRKLEAENLINSSLILWSIARAGGFHWLVDRLFGRMATALTLPSNRPIEPVDTTDFAEYIVESVGIGPSGRL
jgi:hypothetical protein